MNLPFGTNMLTGPGMLKPVNLSLPLRIVLEAHGLCNILLARCNRFVLLFPSLQYKVDSSVAISISIDNLY